ncbi:Importin alpha subunit (Karyopherin alpha subunit) (Serine-rich RNA polymerase I suppressor protein) [Tulasnella sp. 417]|nr:Importin alpha subunit (Karyopherin alpha subunit) (Serine-rich RNA polymerase I suppressor protein) [Tulasnella sp. 417]
MEDTAEGTLQSQSDEEIETKEDSDLEMENEETSDVIELKSYITDDLHIVPEIVSEIRSTDREVRLAATVKVRRMVAKWPEMAGQPVITSGLLETFVGMLSSDDLELCTEAAWILIGVTSGSSEQTTAVVTAGALPKLVTLLPCESTEVMDNALIVLGNIGGDSQRLLDLVVAEGGVKAVLDVLEKPHKYEPKVVNSAAWTLGNYLNRRTDRGLGYEVTRHAIPILTKFIENSTDEASEAFPDVLKSLERISANETAAEAAIATGITPRLVQLCTSKNDNLRYHALGCLGIFSSGSESSTEAPIKAGFLTVLKSCIESDHVGTRQHACWAASNIAAGSLSQAQALFDNDLIPSIFRVISNQDEERKTRRDAVWVLLNLTERICQHSDLLVQLVRANCMEAVSLGLCSADHQTLYNLVEGLGNIVRTQCSGQEEALERFKVAGGAGRLAAIRYRPETRGTTIARMAVDLLRSHFQEFVKRPRV